MTAAPANPGRSARAGARPATAPNLDAAHLADALRAGIHRVFARTDHLNKINVFPVPDGDTGTNLSMTLSAVLTALDREPATHAGALLERVADAALDGARGNSGAILSQFLLGLADAASPHATLGAATLATAAASGAAYARDATSQPKEGMLPPVRRESAGARQPALRARPDATAPDLLQAARPRVQSALAATATQLEANRAAHVVDAGAQGFADWLDGLLHYLDTGETGARAYAPVHDPGAEPMADAGADIARPRHAVAEPDSPFVATHPQLEMSEPRWCTECLVSAPAGAAGLDLRHLRERLSHLGNSLVVGGTKHKARIHVHTDDPERVFALAAGFGAVTGQKADDMQRQTRAAHHARAQRVAIVTDSAADIPEALIEQLGIHVVPLRIHFGSRSYLDKVTMPPAEFYQELARNPEHPKTSQPPPGDFRRMFEFLASHYEHVVAVTLSAKVSGTHDAALSAAQRVAPGPDGRPVVTVIDSRSVSCGQGLLTIVAAEAARDGGGPDEVMAAVQAAAERTVAFALLRSVDAAVKGGRVPPIARPLARWLNLSIVLAARPDGRVSIGGGLWGRHRPIERFAQLAVGRLLQATSQQAGTASATRDANYRVLVGHGDATDAGALLLQGIETALPKDGAVQGWVTDMGTALGVHGGPGTLIVSLVRGR